MSKKHQNPLISFGKIDRSLKNIDLDAQLLYGLLSRYYLVFLEQLFTIVHTLRQHWSLDIQQQSVMKLIKDSRQVKLNTCKKLSENSLSMNS